MRDNDTGFTKVKKNIGAESVRKEWSKPRLMKIESSGNTGGKGPDLTEQTLPVTLYNPS